MLVIDVSSNVHCTDCIVLHCREWFPLSVLIKSLNINYTKQVRSLHNYYSLNHLVVITPNKANHFFIFKFYLF